VTRLFLIGSGSLVASMLPYALRSLLARERGLDVRVGLTSSACRFVTPRALAMISGSPVVIDTWSETGDSPSAEHVDLVEWADAFVVYPATAHLVARFSLGLCDTPFLTALASTRAPVGIAPNVPPGLTDNPAFRRHVQELAERPNVVVAPTHVGTSATTGRPGDGAAGPLSEIVDLVLPLAGHAAAPSTAPGPEAVLGALDLTWAERT
jgi:phosphopantothenoylcysteine synthetase/decarboxylase